VQEHDGESRSVLLEVQGGAVDFDEPAGNGLRADHEPTLVIRRPIGMLEP
jgi:hypothetical protein